MQGENKRPEHKTPEMHMNEHEEKFRSALGDMQAIQANDPLKRLISSALGVADSADDAYRHLLAHTNESDGGGFDRNAAMDVPTNTSGQGGPLEYAMEDMRNNSAPENPF